MHGKTLYPSIGLMGNRIDHISPPRYNNVISNHNHEYGHYHGISVIRK